MAKNTPTEVDLLVVGSGTGMAAALAAKERGLDVLIVEKTELVGGSTARSGGGVWVPPNDVQTREGSADTKERARTYLSSAVRDTSPAAKLDAYIEHGAEAIRMLERNTRLKMTWAKGYSDYHPELPGGAPEGRTIECKPFDTNKLKDARSLLRTGVMEAPLPMPVLGKDYKWLNLLTKKPLKGLTVAGGRFLQGVGGLLIGKRYAAGGYGLAAGMFDGVLRAGIPVWRNSPLVRLLVEDGRVVGAVVDHEGTETEIRARKGVVLSAGGYDHDMAWRKQYQSQSLENWSLGSRGNTGDAIKAGQEIGADVALMDQAWWFPSIAPVKEGDYSMVMLAERSLPGSILVDRHGKRFLNEAEDYMSFGHHVLEREAAGDPVGEMWMIFDAKYRKSYLLASVLYPGMPIPQEWYDAGIAVKAGNWAELAEKIGVDAANLQATAERFNTMAAAGKDEDFGRGDSAYDRYYGDPTNKPNPNLRPIDGKELFAVKVLLSDLGTCGGLRTNEHVQVLDTKGNPIPGLYATGNTAGNFFGDSYPGAGATLGQGIVGGYLAALHASQQ